jgi:5-methylcytosine-specific restriction endonuclease McrA
VIAAVSTLKEYGYLRVDPCAWCGGPGGTIDHITARARGGTHSPDNLTGACAACNEAKGLWPLLVFMLLRAWVPVPPAGHNNGGR